MNHSAEAFYAKLNDIKELYIEVKEAVILAENFDPSNDVLLSPLTELRNSLDHIMRSMIYTDKLDNELDEAKEHLYRAGYDAYEVLAINVGQKIIKIIEVYDAQIISNVFPKYYTDVKPNLVDIKVELGETRAHKRLNPDTGTKSFTPYKEKISNLIKQLKTCEGHIPALQGEKRKRRNKGLMNGIIGAAIAVATIILGTWLYDSYFKKADTKTPLKQEAPTKANSKQN